MSGSVMKGQYSHNGTDPSGKLLKLWEASDKICGLCLQELESQHASRDHVRPRAKGGTFEDTENRRLVHRRCNSLWGSDEGQTWAEATEQRRALMRKHEIATPLELLQFMAARGMIYRGRQLKNKAAQHPRPPEKAAFEDRESGYCYDPTTSSWVSRRSGAGNVH